MSDELARYILAREAGARPFPRAEVYRRLARESLRSVIGSALPVTGQILGSAALDLTIAEFLAAGGPETSLYPEVPAEMVAWALEVEHPLADLMHYEWLELLAARHPIDLDAWSPPADDSVHPNPSLQLGIYLRPVHQMSAALPEPEPFSAPNVYLVWRRPLSDEVVFHRVGLAVGRAIELALDEPRSIDALSAQVAREFPALEAGAARDALSKALKELADRDGVKIRETAIDPIRGADS